MADIETNVVISAQIDGLRSGMEAAANSVQAATDAMRSQLAGLGDIAQQAQSQLNAATGQIGTGIGALQTKAADLAGSVAASMMPNSGLGGMSSVVQASPASSKTGDAAADEKLWAEELVAYQKFQSDKGKARPSGGTNQPKDLADPDAADPACLRYLNHRYDLGYDDVAEGRR